VLPAIPTRQRSALEGQRRSAVAPALGGPHHAAEVPWEEKSLTN